jgi:hypothetical protein
VFFFFQAQVQFHALFHQFAKRTFRVDSMVGKRISSSSETRWTSRSKIVHVLDSKWENLKRVFEKIIA